MSSIPRVERVQNSNVVPLFAQPADAPEGVTDDGPGAPSISTDPEFRRWTLDRARREQEEFRAWQQENEKRARTEAYADDYEVREAGRQLYEERRRAATGAADPWGFTDLTPFLDDNAPARQEPEVGWFIENETSNGGGVFYLGKVNSVFGDSESGKTMFALVAAAQEMDRGNHVMMLDYEDDAQAVTARLRALGASRDLIRTHFHYLSPERGLDDQAYGRLRTFVADLEVRGEWTTMIIIDAVTEAMSVEGLDGRNENDVAAWQQSLPKRLSGLGPAVVTIDHSPRGGGREIGSQHKKSGITGVSYECSSVSPFVIGGKGKLRLRVAKDKIGSVRAMALPAQDQNAWRGDLVLDGVGRPNNPRVSLWGVDTMAIQAAHTESATEKAEQERRARAEQVAEIVRDNPGLSKAGIKDRMTGLQNAKKNTAIEEAERLGLIRIEKKGQALRCHPPEEVPEAGPEEVPREVPEEGPQGLPEGSPEEGSQGVLEGFPEGGPEG
ncbi:AAA family ATPase [Streptomyces olivaceus]|uniref:AAA family ATPase n=1 Tax=Streptomyces olivaceus TaxID=47716 RepID=UPI00332B56AB